MKIVLNKGPHRRIKAPLSEQVKVVKGEVKFKPELAEFLGSGEMAEIQKEVFERQKTVAGEKNFKNKLKLFSQFCIDNAIEAHNIARDKGKKLEAGETIVGFLETVINTESWNAAVTADGEFVTDPGPGTFYLPAEDCEITENKINDNQGSTILLETPKDDSKEEEEEEEEEWEEDEEDDPPDPPEEENTAPKSKAKPVAKKSNVCVKLSANKVPNSFTFSSKTLFDKMCRKAPIGTLEEEINLDDFRYQKEDNKWCPLNANQKKVLQKNIYRSIIARFDLYTIMKGSSEVEAGTGTDFTDTWPNPGLIFLIPPAFRVVRFNPFSNYEQARGRTFRDRVEGEWELDLLPGEEEAYWGDWWGRQAEVCTDPSVQGDIGSIAAGTLLGGLAFYKTHLKLIMQHGRWGERKWNGGEYPGKKNWHKRALFASIFSIGFGPDVKNADKHSRGRPGPVWGALGVGGILTGLAALMTMENNYENIRKIDAGANVSIAEANRWTAKANAILNGVENLVDKGGEQVPADNKRSTLKRLSDTYCRLHTALTIGSGCAIVAMTYGLFVGFKLKRADKAGQASAKRISTAGGQGTGLLQRFWINPASFMSRLRDLFTREIHHVQASTFSVFDELTAAGFGGSLRWTEAGDQVILTLYRPSQGSGLARHQLDPGTASRNGGVVEIKFGKDASGGATLWSEIQETIVYLKGTAPPAGHAAGSPAEKAMEKLTNLSERQVNAAAIDLQKHAMSIKSAHAKVEAEIVKLEELTALKRAAGATEVNNLRRIWAAARAMTRPKLTAQDTARAAAEINNAGKVLDDFSAQLEFRLQTNANGELLINPYYETLADAGARGVRTDRLFPNNRPSADMLKHPDSYKMNVNGHTGPSLVRPPQDLSLVTRVERDALGSMDKAVQSLKDIIAAERRFLEGSNITSTQRAKSEAVLSSVENKMITVQEQLRRLRKARSLQKREATKAAKRSKVPYTEAWQHVHKQIYSEIRAVQNSGRHPVAEIDSLVDKMLRTRNEIMQHRAEWPGGVQVGNAQGAMPQTWGEFADIVTMNMAGGRPSFTMKDRNGVVRTKAEWQWCRDHLEKMGRLENDTLQLQNAIERRYARSGGELSLADNIKIPGMDKSVNASEFMTHHLIVKPLGSRKYYGNSSSGGYRSARGKDRRDVFEPGVTNVYIDWSRPYANFYRRGGADPTKRPAGPYTSAELVDSGADGLGWIHNRFRPSTSADYTSRSHHWKGPDVGDMRADAGGTSMTLPKPGEGATTLPEVITTLGQKRSLNEIKVKVPINRRRR